MSQFKLSRRSFIGMTGAGIAGAAAARWAGAATLFADPRDAELVVLNAKVYTVDPRSPRADAFAVRGGKFIAVGGSAEIKGLIGRKTQTIDAKHMTVVPGFIDCHNHAPGNELLYEVLVGNPYEVELVTIASIIEKLRVKAATTPADTWVEGYFFDDTKLKDQRALNVHDLDQVSTELPVAVHHRGGHTTFYNSKALQMAGVTSSTAEYGRRHLRPRRRRRPQWPRYRSRPRCFLQGGQAAYLFAGGRHEARPRRPGLYLQAICPLWTDRRVP